MIGTKIVKYNLQYFTINNIKRLFQSIRGMSLKFTPPTFIARMNIPQITRIKLSPAHFTLLKWPRNPVHFTCAHCVELHDAESEHCESEFEFEFWDRYDNPESTPLSIWGVFESFFPLESDFIEPPPSLTTFEFITLNIKVTKMYRFRSKMNGFVQILEGNIPIGWRV